MKKSVTLALLLALGLGPVLVSANEGELGLNTNIKANVSVKAGLHSTTTATSTGTSTKEREDNDREGKSMGFRAELVRANIKVAVEVYTATINRLNKIVNRVESRLTKIAANGGSTTEAQAQVTIAKNDIVDAQAQITVINGLSFSSTTATTTLVSNYQTARAAARKAREDLTAAKQSLMKALQSLVKVEIGLHASSTATTTKEKND